jgi:hypothetical protein
MKIKSQIMAMALGVAGTVATLISTQLMAQTSNQAQSSQAQSNQAQSNQDKFFDSVKALCGQAFSGGIVEDTSNSDAYRGRKFMLHIRDCSATQIKMPLHIDDNSSRILILTKGEDNILLQHDHRHHDGTSDDLTLYGGFTTDAGSANAQAFPESAESIEITKAHAPTRTWPSVWSIIVSFDNIVYQVVRPGRTIKTKFNFKNTVANPPKAWDLSTASHD